MSVAGGEGGGNGEGGGDGGGEGGGGDGGWGGERGRGRVVQEAGRAMRLTMIAANSSEGWCISGRSMSPRKKPKLRVQAKMVKKPKITFSRFTHHSRSTEAEAWMV